MNCQLISVMGCDSPPLRTDPRRQRCEIHNRDLYPDELCEDCFRDTLNLATRQREFRQVISGMPMKTLNHLSEEMSNNRMVDTELLFILRQEFDARKSKKVTRKARSTGTMVTVVDSDTLCMEYEKDTAWWTVCDDHGSLVGHRTKKLAIEWSSAPETWCEQCQSLAGGKK